MTRRMLDYSQSTLKTCVGRRYSKGVWSKEKFLTVMLCFQLSSIVVPYGARKRPEQMEKRRSRQYCFLQFAWLWRLPVPRIRPHHPLLQGRQVNARKLSNLATASKSLQGQRRGWPGKAARLQLSKDLFWARAGCRGDGLVWWCAWQPRSSQVSMQE